MDKALLISKNNKNKENNKMNFKMDLYIKQI